MSNTPPETIAVDTEQVFCDGHTADAGHPRVFLTMGKDGSVDCPYCGRRYVLVQGMKKTGTH